MQARPVVGDIHLVAWVETVVAVLVVVGDFQVVVDILVVVAGIPGCSQVEGHYMLLVEEHIRSWIPQDKEEDP